MLISAVKIHFPLWDSYCSDETELEADIDKAIALMQLYISALTAENITDPLDMLHLYIIKKLSFNRKHDDSEFENKPQIIRDYDFALEQLKRYGSRELSFDDGDEDTDDTSIRMAAKSRRFSSSWFTDSYEEDRS